MTKKKSKFAAVVGIALLIAYALGFTVRPEIWNTRNIINQAMPVYTLCGGIAVLGIAVYFFLSGKEIHNTVRLLISMLVGACIMFALAAMWYDCVVEIAYIYGEGNLELGNQSAVTGSILAFLSSGLYVLSAFSTIALSARK